MDTQMDGQLLKLARLVANMGDEMPTGTDKFSHTLFCLGILANRVLSGSEIDNSDLIRITFAYNSEFSTDYSATDLAGID